MKTHTPPSPLTSTYRKERIAEIASEQDIDLIQAMIHYDQHEAPVTTNLAQLEREGYTPDGDLKGLYDALRRISLRIQYEEDFPHKEVSNQEIYDYLITEVLVEPIRDSYPYDGYHEVIFLKKDAFPRAK